MIQSPSKIEEALSKRDFAALRESLKNWPAPDVAGLIQPLSREDQLILLRCLPRNLAAEVFEFLDLESQQQLLKAMGQEQVAAILNEMAPDDRTLLLEELPATMTKQMLTLLTPEERSVAVTLLGYPEGSIGRLMTPDYIAVKQDWTVQYVLDYIREHGHDSETLSMIYVVNDQGVLIDDIRIRAFLLAPLTHRVADLMDYRFAALKATDHQEDAIGVFRREQRTALPVTDSSGVLIGIVTIDDVMRIAEAAATEDIQKIGGSAALAEPYLQIALTRMVKKRAGWLVILFIGEMFTATAMGFFEKEIQRAVVLALFVPLIISSGGNSGSQASTLVIRALAIGEVRLRDWWRVGYSEVFTGLALGSILGAIGFLRVALWSIFTNIYGPHWFLVALTVGLSLIGIVLWGTFIGSVLPFGLRRVGFCPAPSSAPLFATLRAGAGLGCSFPIPLVICPGPLG